MYRKLKSIPQVQGSIKKIITVHTCTMVVGCNTEFLDVYTHTHPKFAEKIKTINTLYTMRPRECISCAGEVEVVEACLVYQALGPS